MKFYWRNKGKSFLLIIIIVVGIIGIHLLTSIFGTLGDTKVQVFHYDRHWSQINLVKNSKTVMTPDEIGELKKELEKSEDYLVHSKVIGLGYPFLGMASGSMRVYGVDSTERKFIEKDMNLELIEGNWFEEGSNQIVVPEYYLHAQNKKVGDTIEFWLDSKGEKVTPMSISGVVSGDYWIALGSESFIQSIPYANDWFLVFPRGENHLQNLENIRKKYAGKVYVSTFKDAKGAISDLNSEYYTIYIGFSVFVSIVIAIALGFLTVIFYRLRLVEFAIKNLVGYSKNTLIKTIFAEQGVILGLGWLLGTLLSFIVLQIVKSTIFTPQGMLLQTKLVSFMGTLIVPLIVLVFVQLFTVNNIRKNNLLEIVLGKN